MSCVDYAFLCTHIVFHCDTKIVIICISYLVTISICSFYFTIVSCLPDRKHEDVVKSVVKFGEMKERKNLLNLGMKAKWKRQGASKFRK